MNLTSQQFLKIFKSQSIDGILFRVDMRLRPFGESGPLAMSFEAMENYYLTHAREWERYAMVKARAVAGDVVLGQSLLETLRPSARFSTSLIRGSWTSQ